MAILDRLKPIKMSIRFTNKLEFLAQKQQQVSKRIKLAKKH